MFRNTAKAFEHNSYAKLITNRILEKSMDARFEDEEKIFAYIPLVYSENLADQDLAIELYKKLNCSQINKQIKMNRDIIAEYGRLPQRNVILGRKSLESEKIFLTNVYPNMMSEYKLDLFL